MVLSPSAWVTSTRLPPQTSQNTAVTSPSAAATTGSPAAAETSVPLWNSRSPRSGAIRHPKVPPVRTAPGVVGAMRVLTGSSPEYSLGACRPGRTVEAAFRAASPGPVPWRQDPLPAAPSRTGEVERFCRNGAAGGCCRS